MIKNRQSKTHSPKGKATLSTPNIFWDDVKQFRGEWYEGCSFNPIPSDNEYPDFLFSVDFKDAGTRETKTRASILISADKEVWSHIMIHPYWRIDPRPLFLNSIREVLWRIKLVTASYGNPTEIKTGVKFRQGGTIYMLLRAEVCEETGGDTIFSLVNWTNTHIPDQLEAVFEQRPEARPPKTHIDAVIADFKAGEAARSKQILQTQRKRLAARGATPSLLSAFIDESGDIGLKTSFSSYTLAATVFQDSKLDNIRKDVMDLMNEVWGKQRKPAEIHFSKLSDKNRQHVTSGLSNLLRKYHGNVLVMNLRKDNFLRYLLRCEAEYRRSEKSPVITNWPDILADPRGQTKRTVLLLGIEEMLCHLAGGLLDSDGELSVTHDKKFKTWMNEALEEGVDHAQRSIALISESLYGKDISFPLSFQLEHSENEPCLWFSDWIVWETGRWIRGEDFSPEFEACVPRMTYIGFADNGKKMQVDRLGGVAIDEFPDVPRDIHSLVMPQKTSTEGKA